MDHDIAASAPLPNAYSLSVSVTSSNVPAAGAVSQVVDLVRLRTGFSRELDCLTLFDGLQCPWTCFTEVNFFLICYQERLS